MSGGKGDYDDEGWECDECDAIPTAIRQERPVTAHGRIDLGTINLDGYDGEYGDAAEPD